MKRLWLVPALVALLFGSFALAQENPVTVRLEVYIVSLVTRDDGTREERFEPSNQARPGQVVEYRLVVSNVGNVTLSAGVVQILGPIPPGTTYVPFSATPSGETRLTEFAADEGIEFDEVNVFVEIDGERALADPTDYTFVRWTLLEELEPAMERVLRYRVTVDR
jgi:uncharacterized repeat protein (TIGR01451 family)